MSSDFLYNGHLVSLLSLLFLQFTCHICSLILIISFIVPLSHSCQYFFLFHLSSTIALSFALFVIPCFVLSSMDFPIFPVTCFFHLGLLLFSAFFIFSPIFVLFVVLSRLWCSCGCFLLVLLIFFLLPFYMVTIHDAMNKASLYYIVFFN